MRAGKEVVVGQLGAVAGCLVLIASLCTFLVAKPSSTIAQTVTATSADTSLITLHAVCGHQNPRICLDSMTNIPRNRTEVFREGGALATDIVMGDTLPARLGRTLALIDRVASGAEPRAGRPRPSLFRNAWRGVSADSMVGALRQRLPSITLTTYDDCPLWRRSQNRAFDGRANGPVRVNRCSEIPMTPTNLASTIVHETAHRIGYRHPHKEGRVSNWPLANCEPPYALGSLVRSIALSTPITSTLNNCAYLIEQ